MKTSLLAIAIAALAAAAPIHAVPQIIGYQGRVSADNVLVTATCQFKFALVNAAGTTTYWSNDGTSVAGSQPTASVALPVANGLYSVMLGDTTLANMTALPTSVFGNDNLKLRVWFNDGTHGFQALAPDQRVTAVGYAMTAGSVDDGAITAAKIAAGAVGPTQLADGAVSAAKLAPQAASANLAASGLSAVPVGGMVVSSFPDNQALVDLGYNRTGASMPIGEIWQSTGTANAPTSRMNHSAVWADSQWIVWGGYDGTTRFNTGYKFSPNTNAWTAMATSGAPAARSHHSAVWTGSQMILWGGIETGSPYPVYPLVGHRFNPSSGNWSATAAAPFTDGRVQHISIWTGSEMLVWGGHEGSALVLPTDIAHYNPTTNTWSTYSGCPVAGRTEPTAVWTGTELIVWGGSGAAGQIGTGFRYNPATHAWAALPAGPSARDSHSAVWTGSRMVIWGGFDGINSLQTGAAYDPVANTWSALPTSNAPTGRHQHSAVYNPDNDSMIIFGGKASTTILGDARYYSFGSDAWAGLGATGAPSARYAASAAWTGSECVIWGGLDNNINIYQGLTTGGRYSPGATGYLYLKQ